MPWFWPFSGQVISDNEYYADNFSFIEGISDDTILLVIFTISLIGLWFYYSGGERNTTIHPDNQHDINILRERAQEDVPENGAGDNTRRQFVGRPRQDTCPICLTDSSVLSLETNCGHLFCGACIITFWKYQSNWMNGMNCPVCRRPVTVLLRCFTANEDIATDNPDRQSVIEDSNDFNRRFSGVPRSFREYIRDIPVLIPHIFRQMFSVEALSWQYRIRFILVILLVIGYVLSPLDILPESVLGFLGLLDDLLLLVFGASYLIIIYRQFLSEH